MAGRRVAEKIEKTLIGVDTGVTYGDKTGRGYSHNSTVFGYMNHPDILMRTTITTPDGTNGATTVDDVLAMIEQANNAYFYGPFMLYHSTDWDKYMDDDYRAQDSRTLRQRLRQIEGIMDVRRLDFLVSSSYPFRFILVQMTSEVARAINGMDITTLQWESKGGTELNFKVMCIKVPQIRSDYNSRTGIVLGTTS